MKVLYSGGVFIANIPDLREDLFASSFAIVDRCKGGRLAGIPCLDLILQICVSLVGLRSIAEAEAKHVCAKYDHATRPGLVR